MLEPVSLSRRSLLKTGVVGTVALVGATTLAQLQGCQSMSIENAASTPDQTGWKLLRPKDRVILGTVAPVALAGAFPADRQTALTAFLPQIDSFLYSTSRANHAALSQLFDLLDMRVTRLMLTGMWRRWEDMTDPQLEEFLTSWRDSSMNQLRLGYAQLTQVLSLVWYAQLSNVDNAIYPGPPPHVPTPLSVEHAA